jgi:hypothetical protein
MDEREIAINLEGSGVFKLMYYHPGGGTEGNHEILSQDRSDKAITGYDL